MVIIEEIYRNNLSDPERLESGEGVARMLAMVEAVFGMFYVTLLIARLVSLYSSKSQLEAVNSKEIAANKRIGSEISQTNSNNPEE